jgi:stage V sporulation protein B
MVTQEKRFAFDVGWVLVGSMLSMVLGFILRIFLARWLGPNDLGLYSMIITVQGVASFIAALDIPFALTKYAAEYKSDIAKFTETSSGAITYSAISGLIFGIILFALSGVLANVFRMPELSGLIRILSIMLPFTCINLAILGLFNGLRRMRTYAIITIIQSVLMVLLILLLVPGLGVQGAVWGIVASVILASSIGMLLAINLFSFSFNSLKKSGRKLLSFGSKIFAADALNMIPSYADTMIIGYFLNATLVGVYSVAGTLASFFPVIPLAIQRITYPATSEFWAQNKKDSLKIMIDKSMKYSACILLPIGLAVGFFSRPIIERLFGMSFISASIPLCILVAGKVISGSTTVPIGASFSGVGRPDVPLKIQAVATTVNVVLNVVLVLLWGISGAAAASMITACVAVVLFLVIMPKLLEISMDVRWYGKILLITGAAIVLFFVASRHANEFIVGGAILIGYLAAIFLFFLTREDRRSLGSIAYYAVRRR